MRRRRKPSVYGRPGFWWVSIPLPFGFRLGHRVLGHKAGVRKRRRSG